MLQLPRVGWRLLACQNGASPDCIVVAVFAVFAVVAVVLDAGLDDRCVWPQGTTTLQ